MYLKFRNAATFYYPNEDSASISRNNGDSQNKLPWNRDAANLEKKFTLN